MNCHVCNQPVNITEDEYQQEISRRVGNRNYALYHGACSPFDYMVGSTARYSIGLEPKVYLFHTPYGSPVHELYREYIGDKPGQKVFYRRIGHSWYMSYIPLDIPEDLDSILAFIAFLKTQSYDSKYKVSITKVLEEHTIPCGLTSTRASGLIIDGKSYQVSYEKVETIY